MTPLETAGIRILVATEPRAYREVLAATVRELRPRHEVVLVEPGDLDGEVERLRPQLVLCSRLRGCAPPPIGWVVLYPNGESRVIIGLEGRRITVADIELDGLLSLVDRIARADAGAEPASGPARP